MKNAYSVIAKFYDRLMTDFNYDKYYEFVKRYATGELLELACGSGAFTTLLLKSAKNIIALDISSEMLNIARQNNIRDRKYVTFLEKSMENIDFDKRFDNCFCVCDGLNYTENIEKVINNVYEHLKDGGYFVFDISSEYKLNNVIGNNVFYEDNDDFTYLWTNKLYNNRVCMDLAVFTREKNDMYSRSDEEHTQYIHKLYDIDVILKKIGFSYEVYSGDTFSSVNDKSTRLLFVCKKNS